METLTRLIELLRYNPAEPLLFTSGMFIFVMLAVTIGCFILKRQRTARLLFLTLFSYYFFYKNAGLYLGLLVLVTITDFLIARRIHHARQDRPGRAKAWLILSLVIDLGLLAYFKYANFFGELIAAAVGGNFQPWDIFLPVGISFFTFKSISYTIDVYRGTMKPIASPLDYAFHVAFFPVLLAGPIVRASDMAPQLGQGQRVDRSMLARATFLICLGLLKKAVVSDYISANFVSRVFDMPSMFTGAETLLAIYGYALQLYLDFSGYSDMSIGIALLLGFRIPDNFNAPYKADSLSDFWRRWHISLSSWIRDYIYIPLGGNRKGNLRAYANQLAAMTLCGLWHGAGATYVVWGLLHGVGVCLHKWFSQHVLHHDRHYHPTGWRRVAAVVITFHLVALLWVPFRAPDLQSAWLMLTQVGTQFHAAVLPDVLGAYRYVFILMAVAFVLHYLPATVAERCTGLLKRAGVAGCAIALTAVIYIVIQAKGTDVQPFIYFQF